MKRTAIITTFLILLVAGCRIDYDPIADFSVDYDLIVPGEVVSFMNHSRYADSYEWDFGDGNGSYVENPTHWYDNEGVYQVTLAAFEGNEVDYAYLTIEVYETTLEVVVRDYVTRELITNIAVTLYPTYTDWFNLINPIISSNTGSTGSAVFKGLSTVSYYVDVENSDFTNYYLGIEDVGFIETLPLEYATHNVFVALVDYDPVVGLKSAGKRERKPVVKEIKRVYKDAINNQD